MKGYKTVLFNGVLMAVGLAEMAGASLPDNFANDLNGALLAIVGLVGVILRAYTTSAIGKT
jgi:hypothetical protein